MAIQDNNKEFEMYARLLKESGKVPKLPEFNTAWLAEQPKISVEMNMSSTKKYVQYGGLALAATVLIAFGSYFLMGKKEQPSPVVVDESKALKAVVLYLKGTVVKGENEKLHVGDILIEKDVIKTSAASVIDIGLSDNSVLRLKEKTQLALTGLREDKTGSQIKIQLDNGKILNYVHKVNKSSKYEINAPTLVAAVRGTSFEVSTEEKTGTVFVADGAVEVTSLVNEKRVYVLEGTHLVVIATDAKDIEKMDTAKAKSTKPEYNEMQGRMDKLDTEVLKAATSLKEHKNEADLSKAYNKDIELVIMTGGRTLRGVVVSQIKGKLIVQTVKGAYILNEEEVEKIKYAQ